MPTSTNGTTAGWVNWPNDRTWRRASRTFHMLRRGSTLTAYRCVVVLGAGLVHLAHAPRADGVQEDVRPEDEALGLAVEDALGLEAR